MRSIAVIPTYNECDNLPLLIAKIHAAAPEMHVLIVDDDSPDGTGRLADRLADECPGRIFVLHRGAKGGIGPAYVAGFRYALANDYEAIVQMDADLSHDPAYLPALFDRIRDCDLVLGSRYIRGVNVVNWDLKRLLLSKLATQYVRIVTGLPVTDATGGFKCWRRQALAAVGPERVFSTGYLFQVETTYLAFRLGLRIGEEPIIFYERNFGQSKLDSPIILEAIWGVARLRLQGLWSHHARGGGGAGAAVKQQEHAQ